MTNNQVRADIEFHPKKVNVTDAKTDIMGEVRNKISSEATKILEKGIIPTKGPGGEIYKNFKTYNEALRFDNDFHKGSILPECVASVGIGNFPTLIKSFWNVPGAGWVQEDFTEELQGLISRKSVRVPTMRLKCRRCWLLVVAENTAASSLFEPSDATKNAVYHSSFDRTFFINLSFGKYNELVTQPQK